MVFLLGVLSLLALSISASPEMSLTALSRGVRQASKEAWARLKRGSKKGKGRQGHIKLIKKPKGKGRKWKKGKKSSKAKGLQGNRKKLAKENGKKEIKGKTRKGKKNKGVKGKKKKANNRRQSKTEKIKKNQIENRQTDECNRFYGNLKDYRYDQNQLRKVLRVNRTITILRNKVNKAATAFVEGAEFFQDCPLPEAKKICHVLRFEIILLLCLKFINYVSGIAM